MGRALRAFCDSPVPLPQIPACIVKNESSGDFFISLGDGAGFSSVDDGNHGDNPCGDTPGFSGAFRAQDPSRWNGKVLRLNEADGFTPHIFTMGHRNPFRMSFIGRELWEIETGWCAWGQARTSLRNGHSLLTDPPLPDPAQTRTRR